MLTSLVIATACNVRLLRRRWTCSNNLAVRSVVLPLAGGRGVLRLRTVAHLAVNAAGMLAVFLTELLVATHESDCALGVVI